MKLYIYALINIKNNNKSCLLTQPGTAVLVRTVLSYFEANDVPFLIRPEGRGFDSHGEHKSGKNNEFLFLSYNDPAKPQLNGIH